MRNILTAMAVLLALLAICGVGFLYSGVYDVAATAPHWPVISWALETARNRSIEAHAAGIETPSGLDDPVRILAGVEHFAAHCAICHGAPGVPRSDIAEGLYPQPPDLTHTATRYSPAELFWILQHGIKMTGMPAWNDHSEEELWATVAFLENLPGMTEQDYAHLVMTSVMQGGGHHHHGPTEDAPR